MILKLQKPPFIHSLIRLAQKASIYDGFSEAQKELLDVLEPLNIEARYPDHKERLLTYLDFDRCIKLIEETEALFKWIKEKL